MPETNKNITYFAETNFRNEKKNSASRSATGPGICMSSARLAANWVRRACAGKHGYPGLFLNGEGVGISLTLTAGTCRENAEIRATKIASKMVLYFAPHDMDWPIAFNVMENVDTPKAFGGQRTAQVFKKIWPDVWSPRMEYILNNCILALLGIRDSTLLGINRMLSDKNYRDKVANNMSIRW